MARDSLGDLAEDGNLPAVSDLGIEGLVHVAQVRSPTANGRLLSIGTKQLPRGYKLITASDMVGSHTLPGLSATIPVLAEDRLSWFGEPIALIAGPDPSISNELASGIDIRWEEVEEPRYLKGDSIIGEVVAQRDFLRGDPDTAFLEATSIIGGEYKSSTLEHFYSEPQGALAYFDYARLIVRTATQWPSHVRDSVASVLGTKGTEIRVLPTRLGVHLDGKLWYPSLLACHAALAAKACKAPARILLTREEDFRYSPKGARSKLELRAAVDVAGRLKALDIAIVIDMGAYGPFADEMLVEASVSALSAYECPNIRLMARALASDTPPAGAFAGLGAAHAFFAIESLVSRISETLNSDPIEWRDRNLLGKSSAWISGERLREKPPLREIGERLVASSDFTRKHSSYELVRKRRSSRSEGPLRGIGFAFGFQCDGMSTGTQGQEGYSLEAILGKDLRLSLVTSFGSPKGGISEVWRAEAARVLAIPLDSIDILPPDTDRVSASGPNTHSRGISIMDRLVSKACTAIQRRRFREPLPISARVSGRVERSLSLGPDRIEGLPFPQAAWAGAIVEIELEPWTLHPRATGIWLCVDGGLIVAPDRARGALRSAAFDAIGASLGEAVTLVDGQIDTESYFSYTLPLTKEIPPIAIDFLERPRVSTPRGIGDLPFNVIPAAFLSAVSQAAGYSLSSLPVSIDQVAMEIEPT